MRRRSKFNAVKTTVDGITFDSGREALRYQQLRLEERAGNLRNLNLQVPFALVVNDVHIAKYIADFTYDRVLPDGTTLPIVEDAKGVATSDFKMKQKLMLALFGIRVDTT